MGLLTFKTTTKIYYHGFILKRGIAFNTPKKKRQKGQNLGINLLCFMTNSVLRPYFSHFTRKDDDSFLQDQCVGSAAPNRPSWQPLSNPAGPAGRTLPGANPLLARSRGAQNREAAAGLEQKGASPRPTCPAAPLRSFAQL